MISLNTSTVFIRVSFKLYSHNIIRTNVYDIVFTEHKHLYTQNFTVVVTVYIYIYIYTFSVNKQYYNTQQHNHFLSNNFLKTHFQLKNTQQSITPRYKNIQLIVFADKRILYS